MRSLAIFLTLASTAISLVEPTPWHAAALACLLGIFFWQLGAMHLKTKVSKVRNELAHLGKRMEELKSERTDHTDALGQARVRLAAIDPKKDVQTMMDKLSMATDNVVSGVVGTAYNGGKMILGTALRVGGIYMTLNGTPHHAGHLADHAGHQILEANDLPIKRKKWKSQREVVSGEIQRLESRLIQIATELTEINSTKDKLSTSLIFIERRPNQWNKLIVPMLPIATMTAFALRYAI